MSVCVWYKHQGRQEEQELSHEPRMAATPGTHRDWYLVDYCCEPTLAISWRWLANSRTVHIAAKSVLRSEVDPGVSVWAILMSHPYRSKAPTFTWEVLLISAYFRYAIKYWNSVSFLFLRVLALITVTLTTRQQRLQRHKEALNLITHGILILSCNALQVWVLAIWSLP